MRATHSKKVGTGSNKRPEKLNVHIRNSWRTNLQRIRSIGNMTGYKKSLSEWQCLSEVKMGRGSPIPPMNATVMEITTWAQEYFQKTLSVKTIHRAIRRCRLKLYRSKKKPYLNMIQKRRRFLWAKAHLKWTVAKWKTVLCSDESKFQVLFGKLGRHVIRTKEDKDNPSCYQRSHPDTIHVWGCFSSKGVGSLTILPKNTAMNKEWYQNTLQQQLLPTTQQQFGEEQCIFQHDGAPCHKAKVITKWLGDQNVEILGPWPGNSPDLNPIENLWSILKRRVDKQKPTNSDKLQEVIMKEWVAISQDLAQKLIESISNRKTFEQDEDVQIVLIL
uniref:Tc1-like transposase DDE domain-containing protein n=1 Tax=Cyprinus carpio carpio TaxID=630221 RepID=A0A9J8B0X6_CYPCA